MTTTPSLTTINFVCLIKEIFLGSCCNCTLCYMNNITCGPRTSDEQISPNVPVICGPSSSSAACGNERKIIIPEVVWPCNEQPASGGRQYRSDNSRRGLFFETHDGCINMPVECCPVGNVINDGIVMAELTLNCVGFLMYMSIGGPVFCTRNEEECRGDRFPVVCMYIDLVRTSVVLYMYK